MKLTKTLSACLAAAGLMLACSSGSAQPVVGNVYPDGKYLFEPASAINFTATAAANITNVTVQLTANKLSGGSPMLKVLSNGNGLNVTGLSTTSISASGVLNSNTIYTALIKVTDATGASTTTNLSFSTIAAYTFEAEDFDYGSGLFIDNPQTNAYSGRVSTSGVDYVNNVNQGNADYRPQGMETEGLGSDTPRQQYANGLSDYDVGWNNPNGGWGNYTRHYPAGTYNIFVRGSNGNGPASPYCADLSIVGGGAASFSGTGPYTFEFPQTGWSTYIWEPVMDANNNLAQVTFDGSASTLRVNTDGGNFNANFYMLLPVDTNVPTSTVILTNIYPDGAVQFQQTNQLTFTANSSEGINASDILVQLTGTTLAGQSSTVLLTTANGLVAAGSANSWNVSYAGLSTDTVYSAFIQVSDVNGGVTSTTVKFDTLNPNYYTFEAEDFNYGGGYNVPDVQTNGYYGLDGVSGVDYVYNGTPSGGGYSRIGLTLGGSGDTSRVQYVGTIFTDYGLQNVNSGDWGNYTRQLPGGTFNIYMRAANGNSANADSASMSVVTGDITQPNQATSKLGTFAVPGTGGWSTFTWVPLKNTAGNLVQITGGSVKTLRATADNGSYNASYYMLVPADTSLHAPPFITDVYPDGTALFQLTNALTFTVNSAAGITGSGVTVVLNGTDVSGSLNFGGSSSALTVSCPLQSNMLYTAVINVTDSYGSSSLTNNFETLDPNSYQIEAEDYDFTSNGIAGQFIDGQINAYRGLPSTQNVDEKDDNHGGDAYRPSGNGTPGLEVEVAGDISRPAFSGHTDYNIGFNDGGNWANYTHNYPAGTYNVYIRAASPGGSVNAASLSLVTGGWGTLNQTTTVLGTFNTPATGNNNWHTFLWAPMKDSNGGLARVTLTGTTNTLRATVVNGGYNVNFYALVPADMTLPVLSNVYPNGANRFQATNTLSFSASSSAGINGSGVSVQLIGTNLLGQTFVTNITTANGLVVNGSGANITATLPLALNTVYTAIITVTSVNGHTTISTVSFDTVSPTFLFEAEDFNYNGGQFIASAQTNGYLNLNGFTNIDANQTSFNFGAGSIYRTNALINVENCSDAQKLAAHVNVQDYDVGNNLGGNWQNYTRNFPAGVYNIYLRGAGGNNLGGYFSDVASIGVVAGNTTGVNQTNTVLGTFNLHPVGWQVYSDLPMIDADGNYAQFVAGGQQTLRLTTDGGNYNANYVFLLPADTTLPVNPPHLKATASGANVVVSFLSRTNTTYQLLFKTNLTDPAWTPVGSTISGNSLNVSVTNTVSSSSGFYRLQTN